MVVLHLWNSSIVCKSHKNEFSVTKKKITNSFYELHKTYSKVDVSPITYTTPRSGPFMFCSLYYININLFL